MSSQPSQPSHSSTLEVKLKVAIYLFGLLVSRKHVEIFCALHCMKNTDFENSERMQEILKDPVEVANARLLQDASKRSFLPVYPTKEGEPVRYLLVFRSGVAFSDTDVSGLEKTMKAVEADVQEREKWFPATVLKQNQDRLREEEFKWVAPRWPNINISDCDIPGRVRQQINDMCRTHYLKRQAMTDKQRTDLERAESRTGENWQLYEFVLKDIDGANVQ